jgi:Zn finger protein HypA/HybF involved in hydrogenase expression
MKMEEIKRVNSSCPNCNKEFKNVYSMSAHKGHCLGLNSAKQLSAFWGWNRGKVFKDLEEVLIENSRVSTGNVKKILINLKFKEWKCECCGITEWQSKPITLELDHINGKNRDHRLENLRLLCPNCHSQTSNFRGRNINTGKKNVSDKILLEQLKKTNIRQALLNVGMAASGTNYDRCKKLLESIE